VAVALLDAFTFDPDDSNTPGTPGAPHSGRDGSGGGSEDNEADVRGGGAAAPGAQGSEKEREQAGSPDSACPRTRIANLELFDDAGMGAGMAAGMGAQALTQPDPDHQGYVILNPTATHRERL